MGDSSNQMNQIMEMMKHMLEEHRDEHQTALAALTTRIDNMAQTQEGFAGQRRQQENSSSKVPTPSRLESASGERSYRSFVPRYAKLDFPSYDGKEDPLGWLNRCDQFFRNQRTAEEDKVGLASFHMTGDAQLWFFNLPQEHHNLSWERFKELCHLRFGLPTRSNPLGELITLRQSGSVEEYMCRFQSLLAQATTVCADQQVDIFTAGLSDSIRLDVEIHRPVDLVSAMSLARAFERKHL